MALFKKLTVLFLIFGLFLLPHPVVIADPLSDLQQQINDLEAKLAQTQSQKQTLTTQIVSIDQQINLTQLRISATEEKLKNLAAEIGQVSNKIDALEGVLEHTSEVLVNRIRTTYKVNQVDPLISFITASDLPTLVRRIEQLKKVQQHDEKLLEQMSLSKKNYHDQQNLLTDKQTQQKTLQKQLNDYQGQIVKQKQDKQTLLAITKSDEVRYQALLDQAKRELDGLKASTYTGKRHVSKGEVIGLMGSTGFSTGPHLHFGVYNLTESQLASFDYYSNTVDPRSMLKSQTLKFDASACDDTPTTTYKSIGSGGWDWPMNSPAISQCYGHTPWSWTYGAVNFHHGLDMYSNGDIAIRAVDEGEAYFYRGNTSFGNNARIFHSNGKMTLYLHMQ